MKSFSHNFLKNEWGDFFRCCCWYFRNSLVQYTLDTDYFHVYEIYLLDGIKNGSHATPLIRRSDCTRLASFSQRTYVRDVYLSVLSVYVYIYVSLSQPLWDFFFGYLSFQSYTYDFILPIPISSDECWALFYWQIGGFSTIFFNLFNYHL